MRRTDVSSRCASCAWLLLVCAACGEGSGGGSGSATTTSSAVATTSTGGGSSSAGGGGPTTSGAGGEGGEGSGGAGVGGAEALAAACFLEYAGDGTCGDFACGPIRPYELTLEGNVCHAEHLDYHCFVGAGGAGIGRRTAYFRLFSSEGPFVLRLPHEGGYEGFEDCSLGHGIPECCCWTNRPSDGTCDGIEPLGPDDFEGPE